MTTHLPKRRPCTMFRRPPRHRVLLERIERLEAHIAILEELIRDHADSADRLVTMSERLRRIK